MSRTQQRDISDNTVRGEILTTLIRAAAEGAPPALPPWVPPIDLSHVAQASTTPTHVWNTSNQLRVMNQHIKSLCAACESSPFLLGDEITCVGGLEWFKPYSQLTSPLSLESYEKLHALLQHCASLAGTDVKEAAFNMHRAVVKPDRNLTQLLLEQHFDGQRREYEVDVCGYMLARPELTYAAWKQEMPRWRQLGLYYPLVMGALCMPSPSHWLPAEYSDGIFAQHLRQCLIELRDPSGMHDVTVSNLAAAWQQDATGAALIAGDTLDRLAVLMGVKSNGRPDLQDFDLSACAYVFKSTLAQSDCEDVHAHNFRCWHRLKHSIESTFPPSTLCTPLALPKRESWGYPSLTLRSSGKASFFEENSLTRAAVVRASDSPAYSYTPASCKRFTCQQTSQRLQDVLWRLGELACSPQIVTCMTAPHVSMASLSANQISPDSCKPNIQVEALNAMACETRPLEVRQTYQIFTHTMDAMLPGSTFHIYPRPQHIIMWRLDTPSRGIIYTGSGEDVSPGAASQHHLSKLLVNAKAKTRHIGGVRACAEEASEETIRNCLKTFASEELWTHPENTVLYTKNSTDHHEGPRGQIMPLTCTTLAESVACLALHVPECLSVRAIGESCAWNEDGIDPRYAEMQLAENGFRLRDWTAMHIGKGGTQQSRLASHSINFIGVHTLAMPWINNDNVTTWVAVSSSLSIDNKTLHGPTLKKAVENRFIHDTKLLPTIDDQVVSKHNCEIYTDSDHTVAIAYAMDLCPMIHFITFQILPDNSQHPA